MRRCCRDGSDAQIGAERWGSYEESNQYDRGAAGEADSVCESAAHAIKPSAGAV